MTVQIVAENLSNILSNFPEINLVYLFGSRVTGQIGPMSDYDVAIQVEVRNDEDAKAEQDWLILRKCVIM